MKQSLYHDWMVRLQMFLAARERHPAHRQERQPRTAHARG
jgi:hypothetical protein